MFAALWHNFCSWIWKLHTCAEPSICRRTAPECTKLCIKFQKNSRVKPRTPIHWGLWPHTPGEREGGEVEGEKGDRGGKGGKGGEGIIHLLLPQAHTAVDAYEHMEENWRASLLKSESLMKQSQGGRRITWWPGWLRSGEMAVRW